MNSKILITLLLICFYLSGNAQESRRKTVNDKRAATNTQSQAQTQTQTNNNKTNTQGNNNSNRGNAQQGQPANQQQQQQQNQQQQQQRQQQNQQRQQSQGRSAEVRNNNRNENAQQQQNENHENRTEQHQAQSQTYHRDAVRNDNRDIHSDNHGDRHDESHGNYSGHTEYHSTQPSHVRREYVHVDYQPRRSVVVNRESNYTPRSVEYRRVHNVYREPVHRDVVWSISLSNDFRIFYPEVKYWRYETGYRLPVVSSYDAYDYVGDVVVVYGQVSDVFYENETDEYFLYFGDYYPYQDFTAIVPGNQARAFNARPARFFQNAYIKVNGYLTEYNDKPEMVLRNARQIEVY